MYQPKTSPPNDFAPTSVIVDRTPTSAPGRTIEFAHSEMSSRRSSMASSATGGEVGSLDLGPSDLKRGTSDQQMPCKEGQGQPTFRPSSTAEEADEYVHAYLRYDLPPIRRMFRRWSTGSGTGGGAAVAAEVPGVDDATTASTSCRSFHSSFVSDAGSESSSRASFSLPPDGAAVATGLPLTADDAAGSTGGSAGGGADDYDAAATTSAAMGTDAQRHCHGLAGAQSRQGQQQGAVGQQHGGHQQQPPLQKLAPHSLRYLPRMLREVYAVEPAATVAGMGSIGAVGGGSAASTAGISSRKFGLGLVGRRHGRHRPLPEYVDIRGSVLILDLSGFTALGERLSSEMGASEGAAQLAQRVDSILSAMVERVYEAGGDVLRFAGDALICLFEEDDDVSGMAEWDAASVGDASVPAVTGGHHTSAAAAATRHRSLSRVKSCCLHALGQVAAEHGVTDEDGVADFTIHGGAAHGVVRCFFLGQPSTTPGDCSFVVSGWPLRLAGMLLDRAGKGEVLIDGLDAHGPISVTEEQGREAFEASVSSQWECGSGAGAGVSADADADASLLDGGGAGVHLYARAYLGTLAARRVEQSAENSLSLLLNELRPVAIVFVGLHDLNNINPKDAKLLQLMNDVFVSLTRISHSCNGAVRDMLFEDKGCTFISVFGAHSHEANPCFDATICAMRMQNALKELELARFSLGVSFGDCFCGDVGPAHRADYVVMGTEVNMAARLMGKAPNRGALVSKRVYKNARKHVEFVKSKEITVKGKDGSFHAYQPLARLRRISSRGSLYIFDETHSKALQQPFIPMPSRQDGMKAMMKALQGSAQGAPKLAFVTGGPFLGKSRLIKEVADKAGDADYTVLQSFRTTLDSDSSYFPFRQIAEMALQKCAVRVLGLQKPPEDEVAAAMILLENDVLKKIDRVNIGSIVPTVTDSQLLSLLKGQNPKTIIRAIVDSLMKVLRPLQPLMLVFEGDGEIDGSSWGIIRELMKRATNECPRLLLIISSRSQPNVPSSSMELQSNAVNVEIKPIDRAESKTYLKVLLGIQDNNVEVDEKMLDVIYDRANGCPLFIEYIVTYSLDKKMIDYNERENMMVFTQPSDDEAEDATAVIPRELSNIVLSAFNNLSPMLWDALKIASCVGYSFDADVYDSLTESLGFIPKVEELANEYDAFERSGDSNRFKWKHQAVYEAVKSLLIKNQCSQIHSMIVDVFEKGGSVSPAAPLKADAHRLLARHCSLAEKWDSAFQQYMEAGRKAEEMCNFPEAAKMYEEAIVCQGNMNPPPMLRSRLHPTLQLGSSLRELARYHEAEAVLSRCLNEAEHELSVGQGDAEMHVRALTALATLHQYQSKYDAARMLYERAIPIARGIEKSGSSLWLAGNIAGYAEILRKSGNLLSAEELHREALEIRNHAAAGGKCTELELAVSFTQLGCTLSGLRQFAEAYNQHRLALQLRIKFLDFSHGFVSESLNYCAETLCAMGKGGDGIPLAIHAVEIRKVVFGISHPALAHAQSVLASCYHSVGRSHDAKILLEQCLQTCEGVFPKNHANLIPNLMNYGKVLHSLNDFAKARDVYERAIVIHQLNFSKNQKVDQLEKCRTEVYELTREIKMNCNSIITSLVDPEVDTETEGIIGGMPIPDVDVDSTGTPIIVLTDVGRDPDDEYALVLMGALKRMKLLNPLAVITTLSPARKRAHLARGTLDALGMPNVPVGVGSAGGVSDGRELEVYDAAYARQCCITESSVQLMVKALEAAPDKSVKFLIIASLSDAATLIRHHDGLFKSKVKEVIVMGGLKPLDSSDVMEPDSAYNNNCDMAAAQFVYERCQELQVPTLTLARWAAYGCPVSNVVFDELCKTAHMIATNTRRVSMTSINHLWMKVNAPLGDPRREKLPPRCNRQWFCKTFFGKDDVEVEGNSIWSLVTKMNMYDPFTMMSCVPELRDEFFTWDSKEVNGVCHKLIGASESNTGIKDAVGLCEKLSLLLQFSLNSALQNNK